MAEEQQPERRVMRTVYLTPAVDEKLRVTAFRRGCTQNDIMVEGLRKLLEEQE